MLQIIRITFFYGLLIISTCQAQTPKLNLTLGHTSNVCSVSFSSDGKYILSSSWDNTLKLWDISTGSELKTFSGHTSSVRAGYFMPDENIILSVGDNTIRFWNFISGEQIKEFKYSSIYSTGLSHNAKTVALASYNNSIDLMDLSTGTIIKTFSGHTSYIRSVCFSPDDKFVLSASDDKTLKLWSIESGKEIKTFIGHTDKVSSVCFLPDGSRAISTSEDKTVKVWDITTNKEILNFNGHNSRIHCVSVSKDGKFAVTGGEDGKVMQWNISNGFIVKTYFKDRNWISSVCISDDGKYILSGNYETIQLWDVVSGKEVRTFKGYSASFYTFNLLPDGQSLVFDKSNKTAIWNFNSGKVFRTLNCSGPLNFSKNNHWIVTSEPEKTVKVTDLTTLDEPKIVFKNEEELLCVDISNDGNYILTGGADKDIKLLDAKTGKKIKTLSGHEHEVTVVKFSPDGKTALSGGIDPFIILWDIQGKKKIKNLEGHAGNIESIDFSSDGNWAVSGACDSKVIIWDLSAKRLYKKLTNHKSMVHSVCFSPDGKTIASGGSDNTIIIWDSKTGNVIHTLTGHTNSIRYTAFMPDGRKLISYSFDKTARLWDVLTGEELAAVYFFLNDDWVVSTPDGLFDGTADGMKKLYYVKGLETIPLENLFEQYYTPKLLSRIMHNEQITTKNINNQVISPIPAVTIISPENNTTVSEEQLAILVKATDQGGGIDEIRLYHNGKLFDGTTRGFKSTGQNHEFTVTLTNGENRIKATAFNSQRTESIPDEIVVHYKAPEIVKPNMHILAVGINSYLNPKYNLNYAKNDADAFVKSLSAGASSLFGKVEVTTINDADATKTGILAAIEKIKAASKAEDVFVFYYAGHGVMSSGNGVEKPQFYLVPHDITKMYEADEMLKKLGISANEIGEFSKTIKAQKQLFVIDACQSGGAMQTLAMRGASEEKAIAQLARSTGTYFIAASGTEQFATEVAELGHGVFTYAVIEAMKGSCKSQDGKVTVNLLKSCVEDLVPELSKKHKGQPQFPTGYGFGMDFPVVMVK